MIFIHFILLVSCLMNLFLYILRTFSCINLKYIILSLMISVMVLPNAQDNLPKDWPRMICGLGLPGIMLTISILRSFISLFIAQKSCLISSCLGKFCHNLVAIFLLWYVVHHFYNFLLLNDPFIPKEIFAVKEICCINILVSNVSRISSAERN